MERANAVRADPRRSPRLKMLLTYVASCTIKTAGSRVRQLTAAMRRVPTSIYTGELAVVALDAATLARRQDIEGV
jgi:hypothetical protein